MKLKSDVTIDKYWQYVPSEIIPDGIPATATTGLRGAQCTLNDQAQGVVYHLVPYDCVIQIDGRWYLLNSLTAGALLEEDDGD